jgi:hypothetical protein
MNYVSADVHMYLYELFACACVCVSTAELIQPSSASPPMCMYTSTSINQSTHRRAHTLHTHKCTPGSVGGRADDAVRDFELHQARER